MDLFYGLRRGSTTYGYHNPSNNQLLAVDDLPVPLDLLHSSLTRSSHHTNASKFQQASAAFSGVILLFFGGAGLNYRAFPYEYTHKPLQRGRQSPPLRSSHHPDDGRGFHDSVSAVLFGW